MKIIIGLLVVLLLAGLGFGAWGYLTERSDSQVLGSDEITVDLPRGLDRLGVAQAFATELGWSEREAGVLASTHAQMQWIAFNAPVAEFFTSEADWGADGQETFLTNSTYYLEPKYDFFSSVYEPGKYVVTTKQTPTDIANLLVERSQQSLANGVSDELIDKLDQSAVKAVIALVRGEVELLPDLVPLPPQDLKLERHDGQTRLMFSTTYYNQGAGPLELVADPATAGQRKDLERKVFQNVYRSNGTYRQRESGTFLWHQPHLHYHFADFVVYDLEAVEVETAAPDLTGVLAKTTFCVRDVSEVDLELANRPADSVYKICKKEKQGISVGWGDTYFYNYPEQSLNVSGLPSGTYRLTFIVNPDDRFDEISDANNVSSALFKINLTNSTLEILETQPANPPAVEHVYPEQEGCSNCVL